MCVQQVPWQVNCPGCGRDGGEFDKEMATVVKSWYITWKAVLMTCVWCVWA